MNDLAALLVLAQLSIKDPTEPRYCEPVHPGDTRPLGWSWRTIDGRQCWYEGPRMLPKDQLRWAPVPLPAAKPPEAAELDVIYDDEGTFQSRWRAVWPLENK